MSWRLLAADVQDAALDTFAERDDADAFTTEVEPPGQAATEVRAIFLDPYLEVIEDVEPTASTREIRADVAIAELPSYPPGPSWLFRIRRPFEGDPLNSTAVTLFEIVDWEPDGEGMARLRLRRRRAPAAP